MREGVAIQLESPSGLKAQVNANGSIRRMDLGGILINLFFGNEMEGGVTNLYLRRHGKPLTWIPLLGPRSPSSIRLARRASEIWLDGECWGIRYTVALMLAESTPAWFWHVALKNTGKRLETLDLIYVQDLGLAEASLVRSNEYFVSQYLDHTPLVHRKLGVVLATRQNLAVAGRHPWCMIGDLDQGISFASDALQVYGLESRAGKPPVGIIQGLPGVRLQHEHGLAAIQSGQFQLPPGTSAIRGFFGWLEADHPQATSEADLRFVEAAQSLPEACFPAGRAKQAEGVRSSPSLFITAPLLDALELTDAEVAAQFGWPWRQVERDEADRLLSLFTGTCQHVVLKAKELAVLRPHGQMLRTGSQRVPEEASLTSTVWMAGVFHSMVTQGHVAINRFLSTTRSYLGLFRSYGLRVFMEWEGRWHLLDVPSAFGMNPSSCRWIYKHAGGLVEVQSSAGADRHELGFTIRVLAGPPTRWLIVQHVALNGDGGADAAAVHYERDGEGILVRPAPASELGQRFPQGSFRLDLLPGTILEQIGGDELLFSDGISRRQPFLCLLTAPTLEVGFWIVGQLVPAVASQENGVLPRLSLPAMVGRPKDARFCDELAEIEEILPWFVHNAWIHYLSPRGLEQYTGGGWGTRDVTQGPVEMLLALGSDQPVKEILICVFKNQNPDGSWPQWFTFFERERHLRAQDAHGDIVFWPLLALARYLAAAEDTSLLEQPVPFFHPRGEVQAEQASLWQHVERALQWIDRQRIEGTHLVRYGLGDWDDSLEPATSELGEELVSSFTVALHYQSLSLLAQSLRRLGQITRAAYLEALATQVAEEFQRYLLADGVLAGLVRWRGQRKEYLMHPRDVVTGVRLRLVAVVQAILAGLLSPEQARAHLALVRQQLLGPDGARLADRPLVYRGGEARLFQRAETSSFFGREIGLMYTHAHLRYAEALALLGEAEAFFHALLQVNPIGLTRRVPAATRRQANCYYTSSDAAFADRYQAQAEYERLLKGEIPLAGGWRVYSSGPGVFVRLILSGLFGWQVTKSRLLLDPVMPKALDGITAKLALVGREIEVSYHIDRFGFGPWRVVFNGLPVSLIRSAHPYRLGGVEIPLEALEQAFQEVNRMEVWLS